jgi:hypothetical protein
MGLADLLVRTGKPSERETLAREALGIIEKTLPKTSWLNANAKMVALTLSTQNHFPKRSR